MNLTLTIAVAMFHASNIRLHFVLGQKLPILFDIIGSKFVGFEFRPKIVDLVCNECVVGKKRIGTSVC